MDFDIDDSFGAVGSVRSENSKGDFCGLCAVLLGSSEDI